MRRITFLTVFTLFLVVNTATASAEGNKIKEFHTPPSDALESTLERQMLSSIAYIEVEEEVDLGFDPYFYLPFGFNPYAGMEFDLNEIDYIDLEEEL